MTLHELSRLRLLHQRIACGDLKKPVDVVSWMGAMQAQDYSMARWAVALRLPAATQRRIQNAVDSGAIIRTHVIRPTWHLVSSRDVSWMLDVTAPHLMTRLRFRHRELEITPAILNKSIRTLESALVNGAHLTREELLAHFQKNKIAVHDQRAAHILLWAELEKVICSGRMMGNKNTYALFAERVKFKSTFTREEGLMNLAARYFQSRGPATLQDFINWSGLPIGDARKALESVRSDLVSEKIEAHTYWLKDSAMPSYEGPRVFLLPAFDEFLIGYKDRSASLPAKRKSVMISINGIFWPAIVVDGIVTGRWSRTLVKGRIKIDLNFFSKGFLSKNKIFQQPLADNVERVRKFFAQER